MDSDQYPGLTQSKADGRVVFLSHRPHARPLAGPYDAVVDIFEHHYDEKTAFWYGVAEVACGLDEIDRAARAAGIDGPEESYLFNPQDFFLRIELADGRWGMAHHHSSHFVDTYEGEDAGSYCRLAFVGETSLAMRPATATA